MHWSRSPGGAPACGRAGGVRPLPDGLALGIPTRFWPAARSGILGLRGQLGLARDALLPRPDVRGPIGDRSIGPLVARKLGQRVVDRLVDPLIGGIHAGSVDDMSAAATYPTAPRRGAEEGQPDARPARRGRPRPPPTHAPLFWALEGGMASLVEQLRGRAHRPGGGDPAATPPVRAARAPRVARRGTWWRADSMRLARAMRWCRRRRARRAGEAAAHLLRPHDDEAAGLLGSISYASVTLVTFRVPLDAVASPLAGTGFLVPRRSPAPRGRR